MAATHDHILSFCVQQKHFILLFFCPLLLVIIKARIFFVLFFLFVLFFFFFCFFYFLGRAAQAITKASRPSLYNLCGIFVQGRFCVRAAFRRTASALNYGLGLGFGFI